MAKKLVEAKKIAANKTKFGTANKNAE